LGTTNGTAEQRTADTGLYKFISPLVCRNTSLPKFQCLLRHFLRRFKRDTLTNTTGDFTRKAPFAVFCGVGHYVYGFLGGLTPDSKVLKQREPAKQRGKDFTTNKVQRSLPRSGGSSFK